jgi:hypothetical protein
VIQASALTAANWLQKYLPPLASDLAVGVVTIWGLFAAFHLLGYLVYQYHEVLGYEPADDDDATHARHDPDQRVLDEAEQFVRDGHAVEALQLLRGEVRSRAVSLAVHELHQRLLRSSGRADELREHSRKYINRLLQEKQERRALALLREALDADPDFAPLLPEQASLLAERAQLAGQFKLALDGLLAVGEHVEDGVALGAYAQRRACIDAYALIDPSGAGEDRRRDLAAGHIIGEPAFVPH